MLKQELDTKGFLYENQKRDLTTVHWHGSPTVIYFLYIHSTAEIVFKIGSHQPINRIRYGYEFLALTNEYRNTTVKTASGGKRHYITTSIPFAIQNDIRDYTKQLYQFDSGGSSGTGFVCARGESFRQ